MKNFLIALFCILLFAPKNLLGQSSLVKQMEAALPSLDDGNKKIDIWTELAWELRSDRTTWNKALLYADSARILAKKINYPKGLADSYMRLGLLQKNAAKYFAAEEHYRNALELRDSFDTALNTARVYNNLGNVLVAQGKILEAVLQFNGGLSILEKEQNETKGLLKTKARLYNNLGDAYTKGREFENAIKNLEAGIKIRKQLNDGIGLANSYLNLGVVYYEKDKKDFDKAEYYLRESLRLSLNQQNLLNQAKCYLNIGNLFFYVAKEDSSLLYYNRALETDRLDTINILRIKKNKGSIYFKRQNYDKALEFYQESLEQFEVTQNKAEIATLCSDIGSTYYQMSDYKNAIFYLNKSLSISDGLKISTLKVAPLITLVHTHELQLIKEQQRRKQILYIGMTLLISIISIAGFLIFNNRKKRQLAEKNTEIVNQEIDELLMEQELKTIYAKLEGQEEERKRVANDLHDRIGVMLSTIKLYFAPMDAQVKNIDQSDRAKYEKANQLLAEACQEVRRISHNMASPVLTNQGLEAQLQVLAQTIQEAKQLNIEIRTHGLKERLDVAFEITLYRIIQELIGNALKHAQASQIIVQLNKFKDTVNIMVEDDGVGFNPEQLNGKAGIGLKNITSKVQELMGSLDIDASQGGGTTISVDLPLQNGI